MMGDQARTAEQASLPISQASFATFQQTSTNSVAIAPFTLASSYVRLNVGGSLFLTTIETLTRQDSMLRAMFSGRLEVMCDSEGYILIDRSGKHFELVLSYLRDGSASLPSTDLHQISEILTEARYYCIQGLIDDCQKVLAREFCKDDVVPVCRIPLINNRKEERALLASAQLPVIKLLLNRHNNKYSYTNQSDDNLLKNLELFEKLVQRFNERILFIKDLGAADEVCSWSFYGNQKKIAEVCCTSIVYATDKKHTKVEFPEARIYEEAMNILLYESANPVRQSSPVVNHHHSAGHRHSSGSMKGSSTLRPPTSPSGEQPSNSDYQHSSGDELTRGSSAPPSPTPEHILERTRMNMDKLALARRELNK